ncbi:hypothetical protein [Rhodococcus sp. UNC363MFTsu5.1]|uniref:hypothetical protein n=1 Tax=Rhodococcus sp. UNC363MFTsu5.1 TaxID=1449069 RepID=UPI000487BC6E|nr:hypothetical protein [Rhodococcus sp. UNC363MFTsu5.1]
MSIRRFAVRAIGAGTVAAAALIGLAGPAAAAPAPAPILHTFPTGPLLPVLGQNAFCNGVIDTLVETDPARPGLATVVLTSRGMHGVGPEWAANPVCRIKTDIAWGFGVWANQVKTIELNFGERAGESVRTEINPGPGVTGLSIQAAYVSPYLNELRPQWSLPISAYVIIP